MDSEYVTQIENSNLENKLLRVDNIPMLEELLNRDSQRLEKLQKLKENNKLDLGNKITTKELRDLFPKICKQVDDFLGIQSKDIPKFGYYNLFKPGLVSTLNLSLYVLPALQIMETGNLVVTNQYLDPSNGLEGIFGILGFLVAAYLHQIAKSSGYNPLSKKVVLEKTPRTELILTAGHEYTHYIQCARGFKGNKHSIFQEGHAKGVERHLSEDYREREDNEAFLYDILDISVGEFKSAYVWMCKNLGKPIRSNLLRTKTTRDSCEGSERSIKRKPSLHAIGNSLFSIYESLHGKQIYSHMIQGDFQFS